MQLHKFSLAFYRLPSLRYTHMYAKENISLIVYRNYIQTPQNIRTTCQAHIRLYHLCLTWTLEHSDSDLQLWIPLAAPIILGKLSSVKPWKIIES